jgi:hypothetical protein
VLCERTQVSRWQDKLQGGLPKKLSSWICVDGTPGSERIQVGVVLTRWLILRGCSCSWLQARWFPTHSPRRVRRNSLKATCSRSLRSSRSGVALCAEFSEVDEEVVAALRNYGSQLREIVEGTSMLLSVVLLCPLSGF